MSKKLRFGLPKGSLQEATIEKMAKAGFNISVSSRSYMPYVDDDELEIRLIRAQEISRYVEHGYLDCGITGHDWIDGKRLEGARGRRISFQQGDAPARALGAVRAGKFAGQIGEGFEGQTHRHRSRQSHEKISAQNGVKAEVEFSWGATEVKAHELVDAIVEVDRDRLVAAREQAAHRGHAAGLDAAADRQPRRRGRIRGSAKKSRRWRCCSRARWRRRRRWA